MAAAIIVFIACPLGAALLRAQGSEAKTPTANEIMEASYDANKLSGSESIMTLTIINAKGQKRVRKMASVGKLYDDGDTEKRLIRFVEPADVKGTGLLTFDYEDKDDDIWIYMPALRKTRRIVSSEKAKSFMGSEMTYADITPPSVDDFTHKVLGEQKVRGADCWIIESIPKTDEIADENGFSKKVASIGKADYMARKAVFYDLDDELHKELNAFDIQEIDPENHKYQPGKMVMENKQDGRKSEVLFEKTVLRPDVPDDYFTTRYLERE